MGQFKEFLTPLVGTENYKTLPLAGDASTRRYYRVVTDSDSYVLMEWDPFENPEKFPFLSVQKYFQDHGIKVPRVFEFNQNEGLFLLEDLGDLTLERRFWEFYNQENIIPYYERTIDELIKIHSLTFEDNSGKNCTAYDIEFSVEKFMWEFNYMFKHLFQGLLKLEITDKDKAEIDKVFENICQCLYNHPQVICHRDFHSRNVMLKHDELYIIDFQDARRGPAVYDLVSLVYDSYTNFDEAGAIGLVKYYVEKFPHYDKVAANDDDFMESFYCQSVQRCLKACGSFSSFFNERGDERYMRYIEPTLRRVLQNLDHFPKLGLLKTMIEDSEGQWSDL